MFLDIGNVEQVETQVIDLMDKDLSSEMGMEEAAAEMNGKGVRTIMLATGIGVTKYNK